MQIDQRLWRAALAALLLLVFAGRPFAQGTTGAISGTIVDDSSQAIPGVAVTLTDERTNVSRATTSGADGTFAFRAVPRRRLHGAR